MNGCQACNPCDCNNECPCAETVTNAYVRSVIQALDDNDVAAFAEFLAADVVTQFDAEPPIVGKVARVESLESFVDAGFSADFDIQNILISQNETKKGCEILATVFSFTTITFDDGSSILLFDTITFTFDEDCLISSERVHSDFVAEFPPPVEAIASRRVGATRGGSIAARGPIRWFHDIPASYRKRP